MLVVATALDKALEMALNKRTQEAVRGLWARTRWARDAAKTAVVERRVQECLDEARRVARHVTPAEVPATLDKLLAGFGRDLRDLEVGSDDVARITGELRAQIEDGIVGPMRELKLLEERLEETEAAARGAQAAVAELRTQVERLRVGLYIAAACAFLALFALLVALAVVR